MNMRKILFIALMLGCFLNSTFVFADPIVELAAPRIAPKVVSDDAVSIKPNAKVTKTKNIKSSRKILTKKGQNRIIKKHKTLAIKKTAVISINYDKVSKMIEYGYYDEADKILGMAIYKNPKDIIAQSLWTVSLAKQCKLEAAQSELNRLLKKYSNNSNLHYAQGVVYYQRTTSSNMVYRNSYDSLINDALKEFQKAVNVDKTNARAYNALGVVSLNLGKQKEAKDYFNKALATDNTYSLAIDNLGTIDLMSGKFKDAENKFKEALKFNSQNTTAMYHLAQVAMQNKNYSNAISYLNDAVFINSNSPAIYNLLGKAYSAQGNDAAAINSFKKSISVKPEFVLSYLDLADIYQQRGDNEFAIEQLRTALAIEPNYYDAKLKLADLSLAGGKYKEAISTYIQLVGIDNYNNAALKGLANAYYGQAQALANKSLGTSKDVFMALDSINKAIKANPQDLELYLAKLKLTHFLNQPNESKASLNKIISSPYNDLPGLIVKGQAYLTLDDYKNAKKEFDSAIKLSKTPEDDIYLTEILLYNKQFESAKIMLNKIIKYDPKNLEALNGFDYIKINKQNASISYNSALFFKRQKNSSSAIEYFTHSLILDPSNAQAHLLLAQLLEKKRDYIAAANHYKAYLSLSPNPANKIKILNKINKFENRL